MKALTWIIAALVVLVVQTASAAPFPCQADVEKLCADVEPGQGRIAACLWSKQAEISAECKAAAVARHEKRKAVAQACKQDAETYCKDVAPGQGRVALCLWAKRAKLTPECKTHVETGKAQLDAGVKACKDDVKKHCPKVKMGQGRIAACLAEHTRELTYDCYVWLDEVTD